MSSAPRVGLIWAQAEGGVIGRDGGMPWHVPEDLAHFREITLGCPVVMGRGTWDSLAPRYRPLPGRVNIVVTRNQRWSADGAQRVGSLAEALTVAASEQAPWTWVIGGGEIFSLAIADADRLEVTELAHAPGLFVPRAGDVHAPAIDPAAFEILRSEPAEGYANSRGGIRYRFLCYERAATST